MSVSMLARAGRSQSSVSPVAENRPSRGCISGLTPASSGAALFRGADLAALPVDKRPDDLRRRIQMVFQNPDSTLNPSHTIEFALSRPLRRLLGMSRTEARNEVRRLYRPCSAGAGCLAMLAASALGRATSARCCRARARRQSRSADCRRAGVRTGCLGAGRHHQSVERHSGDVADRAGHHLARSGPGASHGRLGGGHVSRQGRRVWSRRPGICAAFSPLYRCPARSRAGT